MRLPPGGAVVRRGRSVCVDACRGRLRWASEMSTVRRFTPEATVGPFFPGSFVADAPQDLFTVAPLVAHRPQGQPIVLDVQFVDALNRAVPSVVVEFWQAN